LSISMVLAIPINTITTAQSGMWLLNELAAKSFGIRNNEGKRPPIIEDDQDFSDQAYNGTEDILDIYKELDNENGVVFGTIQTTNLRGSKIKAASDHQTAVDFVDVSCSTYDEYTCSSRAPSSQEKLTCNKNYMSLLSGNSSQIDDDRDSCKIPSNNNNAAYCRSVLSHLRNGSTSGTDCCSIESNSIAVRIGVVSCCLIIGYVVALLTNQVANIVGLLGGLFCTTIMWTFPAIVFYEGIGKNYSKKIRFFVTGLLMMMSSAGYISTVVIIAQMLRILPT